MLKEKITFKNLEGEDDSIEAYFNLSEIEATRLTARYGIQGDLKKGLKAIAAEADYDKMLTVLEDIVLTSYGERNGNIGFTKTPELRQAFSNSIPYSEFVTGMLTDSAKAQAFAQAVVGGATNAPEQKVANSTMQPLTK